MVNPLGCFVQQSSLIQRHAAMLRMVITMVFALCGLQGGLGFAGDEATASKDVASPNAKNAASDAKKKEEQDTAASFLRMTRDDHNTPIALETSIVRYRSSDDPDAWTVDLVAALHIAEKSYYKQLNHEFESYDAVLYELVATEKTKVPKPGASAGKHPLTQFQNGMKDMLGLEFQLKEIDYTCKNMVHADMSPDDFSKSMEERGETPLTMFSRMLGYAMVKQNQSDAFSGGQMLLALFDKNRTLALKRIMAEQFSGDDGSLNALEGPNGSTLISGRNEVAVKVLKEQIAAGKRKMAIFYGAGHMPNLQKQLRDAYHVEPVDTRWLMAWDLKTAPPTVKPKKATKEKPLLSE